ncbi:MAG: hypothetical protein IT290_08915 [Deltaproteobacteria bacterium]|nr:hypothetical protein [Deltaproteobacteria bacterium]
MKRLYLIALFIIPLGVLGLLGIPRMSGDTRALFPRQAAELEDLDFVESHFGRDFVDVIIVPLSESPTEEELEALRDTEESLREISEISNLISPLQAMNKAPSPIRLRTDGWARFILQISGDLSDRSRREVSRRIDEVRPADSIRSGSFYASDVATRTLERESAKNAPLCLAFIGAILLWTTRSFFLTLNILVAPMLTLCWMAAALVVLQIPLGAISQLSPPLTIAIVTSYACYLASRILCSSNPKRALDGAYSSLALATGTTVGGFVSLLLLGSSGVDEFAMIMAASSTLGAIFSILIIPRLISTPATPSRLLKARKLPSWLTPLALALSVALLALGTRIPQIRVDTVPLDFFAEGSRERTEIEHAMQVFPGSHVLSVAFALDQPLDIEALDGFRTLASELHALPGVVGVTGPHAFYELWQYLEKRELTAEAMLSPFGPPSITTEDQRVTRLLIDTDGEGQALIRLADQIGSALAKHDIRAQRVAISSHELVISAQSSHLTLGLLESIAFALGLVWILLLLISRSLSASLIATLPSILPIAGVMGALALAGREINLGAALVAGTSLGMISDYTFHLLFVWKRTGDLRRSVEESVAPFLITGATLVIGFSPTILSPVHPVRSFGILLGSALALGILLNLTLLPTLLGRLQRDRNDRARAGTVTPTLASEDRAG